MNNNMETPKEIWVSDMPNTKQIPDGYDWKTIPEATPENMTLVVNKINEMIKYISHLEAQIVGMKCPNDTQL